MTRDELERIQKMLDQGLDLDRPTQVRLVLEALKRWPLRKHLDGCAWWRGAGCDCVEEPEPEPVDEQLEAGHA